ncbi:MAG TPA: M1 family metallopeptidase, partial [Myxococcales bacterium]|nr:M1 family metallopeptidase [Myxococcales bacterium]
PVRAVYLHLYLNAFEGEGSTFNRERAIFGGFRSDVETKRGEWGYTTLQSASQGGKPISWSFVQPDGGAATDHTVVRFDLPQAVAPGASTELQIEFHDQLPRVVARTGYSGSFHLVAQWFPKIGVLELPGERGATEPRWNCHEMHRWSEFYADFGDYKARITVPSAYTFGSVGVETRQPEEHDGQIIHFVEQDDVHDFAFTAWDGYAPPLEGKLKRGEREIAVKVLYPPEYKASAQAALDATLYGLDTFSRTLGEYPYKQVTVVVPPYNAEEAGGMEYETFFTTIGALWPPGSRAVEYVTVHEFGHGYFMGLLASNEFEEPFLDEGLNEFWDARQLEKHPFKFGWPVPPLSFWDFERQGSRRYPADPIASSSWNKASRGSYGDVYARTVLVMHDLGTLIGEEALANGFREYYRRWHFRHPSTADLEEALAYSAGEKGALVRRWFEEQVYRSAPIDDRIEKLETEEEVPKPGGSILDGTVVELGEDEAARLTSLKRADFKKAHPEAKKEISPFGWRSILQARRFGAHVPQSVEVKFEDGSAETLEFPEAETWHRWDFTRPSRISSAQLDPQGSWLLDLDKLDDGRTRERAQLTPRRWTLEVQAWYSLALAFLEAL